MKRRYSLFLLSFTLLAAVLLPLHRMARRHHLLRRRLKAGGRELRQAAGSGISGAAASLFSTGSITVGTKLAIKCDKRIQK